MTTSGTSTSFVESAPPAALPDGRLPVYVVRPLALAAGGRLEAGLVAGLEPSEARAAVESGAAEWIAPLPEEPPTVEEVEAIAREVLGDGSPAPAPCAPPAAREPGSEPAAAPAPRALAQGELFAGPIAGRCAP